MNSVFIKTHCCTEEDVHKVTTGTFMIVSGTVIEYFDHQRHHAKKTSDLLWCKIVSEWKPKE